MITMKINIQPDKEKAEALTFLAQKTLKRISESRKDEYPENTITDYYDCAHKLMEAKLLEIGLKIKGEGAHLELINHVADLGILSESERVFLQEMREYRNNINYEGMSVHLNYLKINERKIVQIIRKLNSEIKH